MCFSLVFACLSCQSVCLWAGYQELCPATPTCPTLGTEPGMGMIPSFGGSQQAGPGPQPPLWLQRPVCVCAHKCAGMYTGNLCANMYKGQGHITEAGGAA